MKISSTHIVSKLLDNHLPLDGEYSSCPICLQEFEEGYCFCDEPDDAGSSGIVTEAAEWLDAGISPREMAAAGLVLARIGTEWYPQETHYDEKLQRTDVMLWGVREDSMAIGASEDAADLAKAMANIVAA